MFLTTDELVALTGRRRPDAQYRWLMANGFTALRRADGFPVVAKAHVLEVLGVPRERAAIETAPHFDALDSLRVAAETQPH